MNKLNEMIAREQTNWNLLSRHKAARINERTASLNEDVRRQTILGGIDTEYFPWLMSLKPQASEAGNQAEFAQWDCFLKLLAQDKDYAERLMERVSEAFPERK